jgi:antitoxin component of RelBE/YafQ-DinJ toxin-antitoxin module
MNGAQTKEPMKVVTLRILQSFESRVLDFAAQRGITFSEVVRRALKRYMKERAQ